MNKQTKWLLPLIGLLFSVILILKACKRDEKNKPVQAINNPCQLSLAKAQVSSGEMIEFEFVLKNDEREVIDSTLFLDDRPITAYSFASDDLPLGKHEITGRYTFSDSSTCRSTRYLEIFSDIEPRILECRIVQSYPHDATSFTQGLTWHDGRLYESTGNYGESYIHNYSPGKGDYSQRVDLPMTLFGEGITIMGDKLYQLTYKARQGMVYDLNTMELLSQFSYEDEGWGLTDDDRHLILSDGSNILKFMDPETFEVVKTLAIYNHKGKEMAINEMEYIDGLIYANIYGASYLAKIDPVSGKVLAYIDCRGLLSPKEEDGDVDVLNGIAFDPIKRTYYLTGKYWPRLFEVRFVEKAS